MKKPYWVFRQWGAALTPGMKVIESTSSQETVKITAFLSAERTLVVHAVNTADAETSLQLSVSGSAALSAPANRQRTSTTEDAATLPVLQASGSGYADTLPGKSITTYQFPVR